jgi:hypothetical protein
VRAKGDPLEGHFYQSWHFVFGSVQLGFAAYPFKQL